MLFFSRRYTRLLIRTPAIIVLLITAFLASWITLTVYDIKLAQLPGHVSNIGSLFWYNASDSRYPHPTTAEAITSRFYSDVFKNIKTFSPAGSTTQFRGDSCPLKGDISINPSDKEKWPSLSGGSLSKCLKLSRWDYRKLRFSHRKFVHWLNELSPLAEDTFNDSEGIVTIGGSKYSLLALQAIKFLRRRGTTLPVEVFIPPMDIVESESEFCNTILPALNAKCTYISDILPKRILDNFECKGYQSKILAIIASNFTKVLLLDADNLALKNLDDVFKKDPFLSTGLVTWPDFWRRTTTPTYYDIAGIDVNTTNRVRNGLDDLTPSQVYTPKYNLNLSKVPYHDLQGTIPDVSTESGQLLINKKTHLKTIILALYYNVNGPAWYYPIFSQGAAGQGDKETFLASAHLLGEPYYQLKTIPSVEGYHRPHNKGFRGVAILQHDMHQDYQRYLTASNSIKKQYSLGTDSKSSSPSSPATSIAYDEDYTMDKFYKKYINSGNNNENGASGVKEADIMFIHANLPKFDPIPAWKTNDWKVDGKQIRSFTNLKRLDNCDVELELFKVLNEYVCINRISLKYLEKATENKEEKWDSLCKYITDRLDFLNETHDDAVSGKLD